MKTIQELIPLIQQWAKDRNLNDHETQFEKIIEEFGERSKHILLLKATDETLADKGYTRDDLTLMVKDDFGDMAVTVIIYCMQRSVRIDYGLSEFYHCRLRDLMRTLCDDDQLNMSLFDLDGLANLNGYDLTECLNMAWDEIKDRKGETKNGTFTKQ